MLVFKRKFLVSFSSHAAMEWLGVFLLFGSRSPSNSPKMEKALNYVQKDIYQSVKSIKRLARNGKSNQTPPHTHTEKGRIIVEIRQDE